MPEKGKDDRANDTEKGSFGIQNGKQAGGNLQPEALRPEQSRARFLMGCIMLTLSVLGGGFIGPTTNLIENKQSWLKNQWIFGLRTIVMIPLVAIEVFAQRQSYLGRMKTGLTQTNIALLFITPAFQMTWQYGLVYGSENIIQSHAYVCNTLFCIFIVLIGYCMCLKPYRLELIGLAIVIGGIACLFSDTDAERTDGKTGSFWTYSICIGCAFFASFFFLLNGVIVKVLPIFFILIVQAFLGFLYHGILIALLHSDDYMFFSADGAWGAFGFVQKDPLAVCAFTVSAAFLGNCGYVICLLFFSPVIVSASFLLEPFIGQMIGYWFEIDHFPGWLTWLGTVLAVIGILAIQKADRQRKNDQEKQPKANKVEPEKAEQTPTVDSQNP